MDDIPLSAQFGALIILLLLCAFFSLAETSMMALNRYRLKHLVKLGHRGARLTNALLAEVAKTGDRVVLIEDTRELQCKAPNLVALRTKDGVASLSDLVRSSLRLRGS